MRLFRRSLHFAWAFALCVSFLALTGARALANATAPGAVHFEYGYFCALDPIGTREAEGTVSGIVLMVDRPPEFLRKGPVVPAAKGLGFGVHVQVRPELAGPVSITTTHPPMGPNGVTAQTWPTDLSSDDESYVGFVFEHDYELLLGDWSISAEANGREIFSVSFSVVAPDALPPVACGQHTPIA